MPDEHYPSWLSRVRDPQRRATYLRQLCLEKTNEILEAQRGLSGEDFVPPATPPADDYEAYVQALTTPAERWSVERGWHRGEDGR